MLFNLYSGFSVRESLPLLSQTTKIRTSLSPLFNSSVQTTKRTCTDESFWALKTWVTDSLYVRTVSSKWLIGGSQAHQSQSSHMHACVAGRPWHHHWHVCFLGLHACMCALLSEYLMLPRCWGRSNKRVEISNFETIWLVGTYIVPTIF
jgi:hypothetical protein